MANYDRYLFTFSLFLLVLKTFAGLPIKCVFFEGSDISPCLEMCDNPQRVQLWDFSLPSYQPSTCGIVYMQPGKINVRHWSVLTEDKLLYDSPNYVGILTELWIGSFDGDSLTYNLYIDSVNLYRVRMECSLPSGLECSPYHSPFSVYGFENTNVIFVNQFFQTFGSICNCKLILNWIEIDAVDSEGNLCSYSNYTTHIDPLIPAYACFEESYSSISKRDHVVLNSDLANPSPYILKCTLTELDDESYLLIQRDIAANSTIELTFEGQVITFTEYVEKVLTYPLPESVSDYGGLLTATVFYPNDFSWSTCSVTVEGKDPCDRSDTNIFNMPFGCLSSFMQGLVILAFCALIIVAIAFIVFVSFFMLHCILFCLRFVFGFNFVKKTPFGGMMSAALLSGVTKVEAISVNQYQIVSISLESAILFVGVMAFALAVFVLFVKLFIRMKMWNFIKRKMKVSMKKTKYSKYFPTGSVTSTVILSLIGLSIACNNNFVIQSHNQVCSSSTSSTTCSINTVLQVDLVTVGDCVNFSSGDSSHPFAMTITLIGMAQRLNVVPIYWSQLATCSTYCQGVCDFSSNNGAIDECNSFNAYGPSCTDVDYDATGFPQHTNNAFTACYCTSYPNTDCPGSIGDLTKNFGYSEIIATGGPTFEVNKVSSTQPFFVLRVDISQTQPETFFCYITSTTFICQKEGFNAVLQSTDLTANILLTEIYLWRYQHEYFYSNYAQPPGSATSCKLGNLQFETGYDSLANSGSTSGYWYKDWCKIDPNSTFSNCNSAACPSDMLSYGQELPASVSGLGIISFLDNVQYNFSTYLLNQGTHAAQNVFEFEINKNLTFTIQDSSVCPSVLSVGPPVGCYDCNNLASFSLSAQSTCNPGTAYITCNYQLANPVIQLANTPATFIINFYADDDYVDLNCVIKATTSVKFTTENTNPLSQQVISLGSNGSNNATSYNDNPSDPNSTRTFSMLGAIFSGVVVLLLILFGILMIVFCCSCIWKAL